MEGKPKELVNEVLASYKVARGARWEKLEGVRRQYPSADQVGSVLIFNFRHNRYRLIATIAWSARKLYVKAILTHKEYDREEWKRWA